MAEPCEFSDEMYLRNAERLLNRKGVPTADDIRELISHTVARFAIAVEKDLCDALGRPWTPMVGVASLAAEIKTRLNK